MGSRKIKMCKSSQLGARKLRNNERIPNLVSELKSDNIWPLFWQKRSKTSEIGNIASSRPFFAQKEVKCHPIQILQCNAILQSNLNMQHCTFILKKKTGSKIARALFQTFKDA